MFVSLGCGVQELNAEPVIPESFPEWVDVMNGWGHKMIAAVEVCSFYHLDMGCSTSFSLCTCWESLLLLGFCLTLNCILFDVFIKIDCRPGCRLSQRWLLLALVSPKQLSLL